MNSELTEKTDIRESRARRFDKRSPKKPDPPLLRPRDRKNLPSFRGWILYDVDCPSCTASAKRLGRIFRRRGFLFLPLQTEWVMQHLGLELESPVEEIHVLTNEGQNIAGADAVIFLARQIWWAWPVLAFAQLPGMHELLDRSYLWVAAHRGCDRAHCDFKKRRLPGKFEETVGWRQLLLDAFPAWTALIALPISVVPLRERIAPWQFMWLMAAAIFFGCKWLTAWRAQTRSIAIKASRAFAYFVAWPGMDAEKFLSPNPARAQLDSKSSSLSPIKRPAWPAIGKISLGTLLLFSVARLASPPLLAGWIGIIGMALILHFGLFHLLADGWRKTGIDRSWMRF